MSMIAFARRATPRIAARDMVLALVAGAMVLGASGQGWAKPRPIRMNAEGGVFVPPAPEINPIYILGNPPDITAPTPAEEAQAAAKARKEARIAEQKAVIESLPKIFSVQDMQPPRLFGSSTN